MARMGTAAVAADDEDERQPAKWRLREFEEQPVQHVLVTDVHMSFWAMVTFLVKLSIAAIPAMAILAFLVFALVFVLGVARP